jgi:hypothetical protein
VNTFLWVLQALLALLLVAGGGYKAMSAADLATQFPALSLAMWRFLGVLELVGGLLLVVPGAMKWMPALTPIAAAVLCVEALAISLVYARVSTRISAENPLVWSVAMVMMLAFVAYGRFASTRLEA